ncbi:hypothetical protein FH968_18265 [Buttiauxella sp. B2]|uniref:hypothetical protein n=1 Tax=Buttiauxella sp. B2 TaxID=2587812 RepID=UPI00111F778F|nr:hypothetical protein [Buttiauxella sp. B2]TNV17337.1 hypothetical protein FH968_18265 [Buttiauxella sp. B2]
MKQYSSAFLLIKNKVIMLVVLFLMKINRVLQTVGLRYYRSGEISHRQIKLLLNVASVIHRLSMALLRCYKSITLKKGK